MLGIEKKKGGILLLYVYHICTVFSSNGVRYKQHQFIKYNIKDRYLGFGTSWGPCLTL